MSAVSFVRAYDSGLGVSYMPNTEKLSRDAFNRTASSVLFGYSAVYFVFNALIDDSLMVLGMLFGAEAPMKIGWFLLLLYGLRRSADELAYFKSFQRYNFNFCVACNP